MYRLLQITLGVLICCTAWASSNHRRHPSFRYQQGWLGADSAYSIPIPNNRSLWLFGDTFINQTNTHSRTGSDFIHNSIAISRCQNLVYFWHKNQANKPEAIFQPRTKATHYWYWPSDGIYLDGHLVIFLMRVKPNNHPDAFGFQVIGNSMASIDNADDSPHEWQMHIQALDHLPNWIVATAIIRHKGWVYLFATTAQTKSHQQPIYLIRVSATDLRNDHFKPQILSKNGHWCRHGQPCVKHAKVIIANAATEMSISHDTHHHRWLAIYSQFPNQIILSTAKQLTGPWSPAKRIYSIPLPKQKDADVFCYAAKAHNEYNTPQSLALTYVCNSSNNSYLMHNLSIYQPKWWSYRPPLDHT